MINNLVIRRALTSDISQIIEFTKDTFTWGDYVPRVINEWVNDGTVYVAAIEDKVVGVVNMVMVREMGTVWLEGIRIRPSYRRMGIGRVLTEYLLNEALRGGARYAMLMIAEWNEPSQRLVKSLEFHEVLILHAGVAKPSQVSVIHGNSMREVIREALRRTNGYFCTTERHWLCTRATEDFVMAVISEIYVGRGIGLGSFSVGSPTMPVKTEVLATEYGDFENYYGRYIVYERELGQVR